MPVTTIIAEDEPLSRAFLKNLLAEFCPEVNVVATPATEDETIATILTLQPQLVFMDIELQQGTGFKVLQKTRQHNYHVIFTTALDHSAIRAIRFSGVAYLQKPIDIDALKLLVKETDCDSAPTHSQAAVQHLLHTLDNHGKPLQLLVNSPSGRHYIDLSEIIYIKAQGTESIFYTNQDVISAHDHNINDYEKLLNDLGFLRTHPEYIIQIGKVAAYSGVGTASVKMLNNEMIPVSPKRQARLQDLLAAT